MARYTTHLLAETKKIKIFVNLTNRNVAAE